MPQQDPCAIISRDSDQLRNAWPCRQSRLQEEQLLGAQSEKARLQQTNAALASLARETTDVQAAWAAAAAVQRPEHLSEKLTQLTASRAELAKLRGMPVHLCVAELEILPLRRTGKGMQAAWTGIDVVQEVARSEVVADCAESAKEMSEQLIEKAEEQEQLQASHLALQAQHATAVAQLAVISSEKDDLAALVRSYEHGQNGEGRNYSSLPHAPVCVPYDKGALRVRLYSAACNACFARPLSLWLS